MQVGHHPAPPCLVMVQQLPGCVCPPAQHTAAVPCGCPEVPVSNQHLGLLQQPVLLRGAQMLGESAASQSLRASL